LRADAINALNRPYFGTPPSDINSVNFGRVDTTDGTRIMVVSVRSNF
jgi:hypothetical protein